MDPTCPMPACGCRRRQPFAAWQVAALIALMVAVTAFAATVTAGSGDFDVRPAPVATKRVL